MADCLALRGIIVALGVLNDIHNDGVADFILGAVGVAQLA